MFIFQVWKRRSRVLFSKLLNSLQICDVLYNALTHSHTALLGHHAFTTDKIKRSFERDYHTTWFWFFTLFRSRRCLFASSSLRLFSSFEVPLASSPGGVLSPASPLSLAFFSLSFTESLMRSLSCSLPCLAPLSESAAFGKVSRSFGLFSGSRVGRESRRLSGLRSRRPLVSLPLSLRKRSSRPRSLPELSGTSLRSLRLVFRLSSGRRSSERRLSGRLPNLPESGRP